MKKIHYFLVFCFLMFALIMPLSAVWANSVSGGADGVLWDGQASNIQANVGLGNQDPRISVAKLINIVLGFLGILSLVLIMYAGFKWMTAAGNDEQVVSAKKLLSAGIIGLVIILSAFALAGFVLDAIFRATTA